MIRFKNYLTSEQFHSLNQQLTACIEELNKLEHLKTLGKETAAEKAIAKEKLRKVFNELIEGL